MSPSPGPVAAEKTTWAEQISRPSMPLVRADAETYEMLTPEAARAFMVRLSDFEKQLFEGGAEIPQNVSLRAIQGLVEEWKGKENLHIVRSSSGECIVRSNPANVEFESYFAVLSADKVPVLSGLLTDRGLQEHWPKEWQDYRDAQGQVLLDHCCGLGKKVELLRQEGIIAHGVDITAFGSTTSDGIHYGRAERLPFLDAAFDRVESRMGVLLWAQNDVDTCRKCLAEMVRVTKDGGKIRICGVSEQLLRALVSEREDLSFGDCPANYYGAFELRVQRPSGTVMK